MVKKKERVRDAPKNQRNAPCKRIVNALLSIAATHSEDNRRMLLFNL